MGKEMPARKFVKPCGGYRRKDFGIPPRWGKRKKRTLYEALTKNRFVFIRDIAAQFIALSMHLTKAPSCAIMISRKRLREMDW